SQHLTGFAGAPRPFFLPLFSCPLPLPRGHVLTSRETHHLPKDHAHAVTVPLERILTSLNPRRHLIISCCSSAFGCRTIRAPGRQVLAGCASRANGVVKGSTK